MKKTKLQILPLALLSVLLLTILVNTFSVFLPKATADSTYSWKDEQILTKKYSAVTAFLYCVQNASPRQASEIATPAYSVEGGNLSNFKWRSGTLVNTGAVLGDDGTRDGRLWCDTGKPNVALSARDQLGYDDDVSFLKDLGFEYVDARLNPYWKFTDGKGVTNTNITIDMLETRIKNIAINKGVPLTATKPMQYVLLRDALLSADNSVCRGTATLFSTIDSAQQVKYTDSATSTLRKIKMINEADGTAQDYGVKITNIGSRVGVFPGDSNDIGCNDIATQINDLTPSVVSAVAAETITKNENAELEARKAAAAVYAATLCKDVTPGPLGSTVDSAQAACAAAVLKCLQPYTKTVTVKVGTQKITETVTYNATPENIDPETFAQCIYDAKVTNLSLKKIVSAVKNAKNDADKAAAAARKDALVDECTADPSASGCADVETAPDCPLNQDTFMRWMGCGLITLTGGIINTLYGAIKDLLYTPVEQIFKEDFKKVVDKFRIFGMALIFIAGLVMVIAQATGSDLVDAYTVRKVLPRLAFAIVGMALAWPLLILAIGLTNDLGLVAGSFIANMGGGTLGGSDANIASAGVNFAVGLPIAFFAIVVRLGWSAVSLLGTAGLALLIGLLVLAIRQLVVIVLVLLAPLAIAASVLPGTDKLWKFWKNTLITTLAMFPIIMLFLKSGEFFARITNGLQGDQWAIIGIIAYFAPYFMLPFAFKMAGGLMSNIFGIVNDRGKGLFDRMRNHRAEAWKERKVRAGQGHLWDNNNAAGRLGNKFASFGGDFKGSSMYYLRKVPGFRREGERVASQIAGTTQEHTEKVANMLAAAGVNDRGGRALAGLHQGLSEGTIRRLKAEGLYGKRVRNLKDLERMTSILASSTDQTSAGIGERQAAHELSAVRGRLATLYKDQDMGKADLGSAGMMVLAAAGYAGADDINTFGNNLRRDDQLGEQSATGITERVLDMASSKRLDVKKGYTNVQNENGEWHRSDAGSLEEKNRAGDNILTKGYNEFAGAKAESFVGAEEAILYNLDNRGDEDAKERQILQLQQILQGSLGTPALQIEAQKFVKQGVARYSGLDSNGNPDKSTLYYQPLPDDVKNRLMAVISAPSPGDLPDALKTVQQSTGGPIPPQPGMGGGSGIPGPTSI